MFNFSNPQNREQLLVIAAGIVLCGIVVVVLPAMFNETTRLKNNQQKLIRDIEEHEKHARNKEEIQNRLTAFTNQALSSSGNIAASAYRNWLEDLMRDVGLRYQSSPPPQSSPLKGIYTKYTFTVTGTGKLDQIAEFLGRFHRSDYLHLIQSVSPRPSTQSRGEFDVTIKIEALALPEGRLVNAMSLNREAAAMTDDEKRMLATIRDRAILSEYTPPRPPDPGPPPPPPPPDFDDTYYCIVNAIVEADGKPQCWIDYRTEGKKFYLFEGQSFMLGTVRCTIKKIEVRANRVQIAAAGGLYAVKLGKSFGESDDPCCSITAMIDEKGERWSADSTGKPRCRIENQKERKRHELAEGESFLLNNVNCTIKKIEPRDDRVQIEAVGVEYTFRVGESFAEFEED